jgi:serine protease AprX
MSRRLPVLAALVAVLALLAPPALASGPRTGDTHLPERMSPGFTRDLASLAPSTHYGAFVSVQSGLDAADVVARHTDDVQVLRNYERISAAFVGGPISSIAGLADVSSVEYIQDNATLEYHGDTAPWATRVGVVREPVAGGPYFASVGGPILDGTGVGVAIIDSGGFGAHPDLANVIDRNYKFVCTTPGLVLTATNTCAGNGIIDQANGDPVPTFGFIDVGDTSSDTSSGHGTHVAGILAGDGTQSLGSYPAGTGPNTKGTYTGIAPGASVSMYGAGEVISVLFAVESLYHVLLNGNTFVPRVSIVSNSWGNAGGSPYVATDIINVLVNNIVANDVTVVFSASNDGGTGSADMTSGYCKNPTPGVICVANYDDEAAPGGRDGGLNPSSSRGLASDTVTTATWPDISAPGTLYTAACVREVQPICNLGYVDEIRWGPWYSSISGTSMSTPHVSGAIALIEQAHPALTPAQIEDVIQDTAYKFTFGGAYFADPQNPGAGDTTSFDKGAGLLDVTKALDTLGTAKGTAVPASCYQLFGGDGGDAVPGAADLDSLCVTQTPAGFRYDLTLVNAGDFGPPPANGLVSAAYRLYQTIKGVEYTTDISATVATVTPGVAVPPTAVAVAPSRTGNVVTFTIPFANLGNPAVGEPIYNVRMGAFFGAGVRPIVDIAPSSEPAAAALNVRPMWARPYARA